MSMLSKEMLRASTFLTILASASGVARAQSWPTPFTTGHRYDLQSREVGVIYPSAGTAPGGYLAERTSYDAAGRPVKFEKGFLAAWQPETIAPAMWNDFTIATLVEVSYDRMGRKLTEAAKGSDGSAVSLTQYSYDSAGRLDCSAIRMNPAIYTALPASACLLSSTAAQDADRITQNTFDAASQLLKVQKAVGTALQQDYATYSYNANGKQTSITDARGFMASMLYDGLDRQVRWNFPSPTATGTASATDYEEYGYDANGNRTSLRRREGAVFTFQYDALNRVTLKVIPERSGLDATHTRDVYYGYDLRGLQTYARFDSASGEGISNAYDGLGRLSSTTQMMDGASRTLAYQYDANGSRTRITHSDGNWFGYDYDGLGRNITLRNAGGAVARFYFNPQGMMSLKGQTSWTSYGYDAAGRLNAQSEDIVGTSADTTTTLSYNPASQIAGKTQSNDAYAWTGSYNIDRGYSANGLNQYTAAGSASFTYDANGNLTSDGTNAFVYDVENRLVARSGGGTAALRYDPLGRLYEIAGGTAGTQRLLYDGDALVAEYSTSGTMLARHVFRGGGDDPLMWYPSASFVDADSNLLKSDYLGSITVVMTYGGTPQAINTYDEYGIPGAGNQGRFQYTGQAWLPELGMYYYKARMYSPTLGRFMQTDPIGYKDQINLYLYVNGDPLNNSDPTGLRDIYIGGADDKNGTRIVQNYERQQSQDNSGRDVQYFSWADTSGIKAALNAPLFKGEPLNVIGHSLGAAAAIAFASGSRVKITNLITIDPVRSAGTGEKPANVEFWGNVTAAPQGKADLGDLVAAGGRAALGETRTGGADSQSVVNRHHGQFPEMMNQSGAAQIVDRSYVLKP